MSEKVPIDGFKWVPEDQLTSWGKEEILAMNPEGTHSYILEVDVNIPEEIHDRTSEYPLLPEPLKITKEMISPKSWLVLIM